MESPASECLIRYLGVALDKCGKPYLEYGGPCWTRMRDSFIGLLGGDGDQRGLSMLAATKMTSIKEILSKAPFIVSVIHKRYQIEFTTGS